MLLMVHIRIGGESLRELDALLTILYDAKFSPVITWRMTFFNIK